MPTDLDPGRAALPASVGTLSNCANTSLPGILSIPQLGTGTYMGQQGGNFPGGTNIIPPNHLSLGLSLSSQVLPRAADGTVDMVNGKIVQTTIGASTASRLIAGDSARVDGVYPNAFKPLADADPAKNPKLVIVNGTQPATSLKSWLNPADSSWIVLYQRLAAAGVTPAQVQVVWFMVGDARPYGNFPAAAWVYRDSMEYLIRDVKSRFPNTALAFLSSHHYQGYRSGFQGEPLTYQQGFGLKAVIQDQIQGLRNMNADRNVGPVVAPWVSWASTLWSNGIIPNADGLAFPCADFDTNGIHLNRTGVDKAGPLLLSFFKTDPTTTNWFIDNAGQLGDLVWNDVDGNGIQDLNEPGLAGLTVTLAGPGVNRTTTTNSLGQYAFTGLPAGAYTISVSAPAGYVATPTGAAGSDSTNDSNDSPASVSLATNAATNTSIDIGYTARAGAIGDFVWNDVNRNGLQDAGEPGLAGVTVVLSGAASATTTTSASGYYSFGNLMAGTYSVTVATPAGFSPTIANQGSDPLLDSNGSPANVTLATNATSQMGLDVGFVEDPTGQIGDRVWYDLDGNGVQDASEPGIAGATVTLTTPGGTQTTTTDLTGRYLFTGLAAGSYTVAVAPPGGFVPTPSSQGGDTLLDSNGSPAAVSLPTYSSVDPSVDFGFTKEPGTIGDLVWNDLNGNGVQDPGEPGLGGVTITLAGASSASTTTDASGNYSFGGLSAGSYTVTVTAPSGFTASPANQGSDSLKDSHDSPATVILATASSASAGIDFGFVATATGQIGDLVWYDVDGNGVQNSGEPGLAGVTVTLSGPGGPLVTTTDATGRYLFTGLAAGTFSVSAATPGGYLPSPSNQGGDPLRDSNGSPAAVILATPSTVDASVDLGFRKGTGSIGDFIWNDLNFNGVQDAGEPGLSGLTVTLSGTANASTTTAADGSYAFANLFPGNYTVTVTPPSGYSPTLTAQGTDPLKDSNGSPAPVSLATDSSSSPGTDFGYVQGQIITLDRTSTASSGTGLVTSLSWSHTIGSTGVNRILLVSVGLRNKSSQTVSTVKFGGVNLTRIAGVSQGVNVRSEMWYLLNPGTGTKTIAVTLSGSGAAMIGGAVSYTGVHQTTPLGTPVTAGVASATAASVTVSSAFREVVVDAAVKQNSTESQAAAAGQTRRWIKQTTIAAANGAVFTGSDKPGAQSVTMGWTASAARNWAMVAVALRPGP